MNDKEIEEAVINVISYQQYLPKEDIKTGTILRSDLGMDSLDILEIGMEIEAHCEVNLSDEQIEEWVTVEDIIKDVKQKF